MVKVVKYENEHLNGIISAAEQELSSEKIFKLKTALAKTSEQAWALTCFSESGEIIGYALGELLPRGEELLKDIYVIPLLRRQGIGSVILVSAFYHATLRLSLRINAECENNSVGAAFLLARTFTVAKRTQNVTTLTKSLLPMYQKEKED